MDGGSGESVRIETGRLLLRRVEEPDAPVLARLWSDPRVTRYMGGPRDFENVRQESEEEARAGLVHPTGWWPVAEKASGRVIGDCGLIEKKVDGREEIELVYVFASDSWGKGYATEAAGALRDYAFFRLGLRRVVALIDPDNHASARVAEKIGMQFERETRRPSGRVMRVYALASAHASTR
jgi:ribosomal-protein-alanine N-acetyltransferase